MGDLSNNSKVRQNKNIDNKMYERLCDAILSLQTREECMAFLDDICTIKELEAITQRLEVARMLKGSMTYLDVAAATGASTATISRVNRALNYGSDGYDTVLERISKDD